MPDRVTSVSTFTDGVLVLVNGVSDLALVMDSPNCGEDKAAKAGLRQDLFSTLNPPGLPRRTHFTEVGFSDMTLGTEPKVVRTIRCVNQALNPAAILVTGGSPIDLTGEYHGLVAKRLSSEIGKPVFALPSRSLSGDFLDGFCGALAELVSALPMTTGEVEPGTVGIVGLPFERSERDHLANVNELQRLLRRMGLKCLAVLPSGVSVKQCATISGAQWLLALPHGREAGERLSERLGRPVLQLPLPVGLDGTARWLRSVGQFTGNLQQAEALIESELERCVPLLRRPVRSTLAGTRMVVAMDPYIAQALIPALAELGLQTAHLMLRTRSSERVNEVTSHILSACPDATLESDTPLPELEMRWNSLFSHGIRLAIGTTLERSALGEHSIPYLEIGFPSYVRHAVYDAPWMGFKGLMWLADRLYNLISEHRYRHGDGR